MGKVKMWRPTKYTYIREHEEEHYIITPVQQARYNVKIQLHL